MSLRFSKRICPELHVMAQARFWSSRFEGFHIRCWAEYIPMFIFPMTFDEFLVAMVKSISAGGSKDFRLPPIHLPLSYITTMTDY